jgi:Histidine kinase-, DNA gyrase B-, and HSP90-like ATPase
MIQRGPSPKLLRALRHEAPSWSALCAEATDNSLDAGATTVRITLADSHTEFRDDGQGVDPERLDALIRFGEHAPMETTTLGMFGVGVKLQALRVAKRWLIKSTSRDHHLTQRVDWEAVEQSDSWAFPDPHWGSRLADEPLGTSFTLHDYWGKPPRRADVEKVMRDLAVWFHPALVSGRTLIVNERPLAAAPEPRLLERIEGTIDLAPDKRAHYIAGLLPDLQSRLHHVHVAYGHRVIKSEDKFGCGDHGGLRRFFARVTLVGDWELTTYKDDLRDLDCECLEEDLEARWKALLQRCESQEVTLNTREIEAQLNALLPPTLRPVRPLHTQPPRPPRADEKEPRNNRQHRPVAAGTPGGPARQPQSGGGLSIKLEPGLNDEHGMGRYLAGRPARVELATDNPQVAYWQDLWKRNNQAGLTGLVQIAMALYAEARGGQLHLWEPGDAFGVRMAKLAQLQPAVAGDVAS